MNGQLAQAKAEKDSETSQLQLDLNAQFATVREIEDRLSRLTTRLKPLLLSIPESDAAVNGPASVPLRSAFTQGVADQNERLRAISRQLARLDYELDF